MIIKSFLIVAMAAFDLSIMSRCAWADSFVNDSQFAAHDVKRVCSVSFFYVSEFSPIIRLQDLWLIAEVTDRTPQKICG